MKHSILPLLVALSLYAAPNWYHRLEPDSPSLYIGYGQGQSESEAKRNALNDIAEQISINVESKFSSEAGMQSGKVYRNVADASSHQAKAKISGYEVLRIESEEGIFYIAVSYENIPSLDKFNRELKKQQKSQTYVSHPYLGKTPVADELSRGTDFALKRKDGLWFIACKEIMQPLDQRDFLKFFATVHNEELALQISKGDGVLYEGDEFYFKVKSSKNGYITIFTVYEDGTVATLVKNMPVNKGKTEAIPDKDFEAVLQAGLIVSGMETFDLYVAVFTPTKRDYDQFARADEELIEDERYKNFDELIRLMQTEIFSTMKVITKPR